MIKLLLIAIPQIVLAAGSAGSGSPAGLIWPAINLFLVIAILCYFVGPLAKEYFQSKSQDVDLVMKRAEVKAKEARDMMAIVSRKMNDSDQEVQSLKENANKQVSNFSVAYADDVEKRIEFLNKDAQLKLQAEKKSLSDSINTLLVDRIVQNSKFKIASDQNLSHEVKQELLKSL